MSIKFEYKKKTEMTGGVCLYIQSDMSLEYIPSPQLPEIQRGQARNPCRYEKMIHKSSGVSPVCLAIRASIRCPISSRSWKAKTKFGHPLLLNTRWEVPDWRLIVQPILNNAFNTFRALVDGH